MRNVLVRCPWLKIMSLTVDNCNEITKYKITRTARIEEMTLIATMNNKDCYH